MEETSRPEKTFSVALSSKALARVQHIADVKGRRVEEVIAELAQEGMQRPVLEVLYADADSWQAWLQGASLRLAEVMRELNALPLPEAAKVIALTHASVGGLVPESHFQAHVERLTQRWVSRGGLGTSWGRRVDGTVGPLEDLPVSVTVTPQQWDLLAQIGAPGSVEEGLEAVVAAGIERLRERNATREIRAGDTED